MEIRLEKSNNIAYASFSALIANELQNKKKVQYKVKKDTYQYFIPNRFIYAYE